MLPAYTCKPDEYKSKLTALQFDFPETESLIHRNKCKQLQNNPLDDSVVLDTWLQSYVLENHTSRPPRWLFSETAPLEFPCSSKEIQQGTHVLSGSLLDHQGTKVAWPCNTLTQMSLNSNDIFHLQKSEKMYESPSLLGNSEDISQDPLVFCDSKSIPICSRNVYTENALQIPLNDSLYSLNLQESTVGQSVSLETGKGLDEASKMIQCIPLDNPRKYENTVSSNSTLHNSCNDVLLGQKSNLALDFIFHDTSCGHPLGLEQPTDFAAVPEMRNLEDADPSSYSKVRSNTNHDQQLQEALYENMRQTNVEPYPCDPSDSLVVHHSFPVDSVKNSSSSILDYYMFDQMYQSRKNGSYDFNHDEEPCTESIRMTYDVQRQDLALEKIESSIQKFEQGEFEEKQKGENFYFDAGASLNNLVNPQVYSAAHPFMISAPCGASCSVNKLKDNEFFNTNVPYDKTDEEQDKKLDMFTSINKSDSEEMNVPNDCLEYPFTDQLSKARSELCWLENTSCFSTRPHLVSGLHACGYTHCDPQYNENNMVGKNMMTIDGVDASAFLTKHVPKDQHVGHSTEPLSYKTRCDSLPALTLSHDYESPKVFFNDTLYEFQASSTTNASENQTIWRPASVANNPNETYSQPTLEYKKEIPCFHDQNLFNDMIQSRAPYSSTPDLMLTSAARLRFMMHCINKAAMSCVYCVLISVHWILWVTQQWCLWKHHSESHFTYDTNNLFISLQSDLSEMHVFSVFLDTECEKMKRIKSGLFQSCCSGKEVESTKEWTSQFSSYWKDVIDSWLFCLNKHELKKDLNIESQLLTKNCAFLGIFFSHLGYVAAQDLVSFSKTLAELIFKDNLWLIEKVFDFSDETTKPNTPLALSDRTIEETLILHLVKHIKHLCYWFRAFWGNTVSNNSFVKRTTDSSSHRSMLLNESLHMFDASTHSAQQTVGCPFKPYNSACVIKELVQNNPRNDQQTSCLNFNCDKSLLPYEVSVTVSQFPEVGREDKLKKKCLFMMCQKRHGDTSSCFENHSALPLQHQIPDVQTSSIKDPDKFFSSPKQTLGLKNSPRKMMLCSTPESLCKPDCMNTTFKVKEKGTVVTKKRIQGTAKTPLENCSMCYPYDYMVSDSALIGEIHNRNDPLCETCLNFYDGQARRPGQKRSQNNLEVPPDGAQNHGTSKPAAKKQKDSNKRKSSLNLENVEENKENEKDYTLITPNNGFRKRSYAPGLYFDRRRRGFRIRFQNIYVGWVSLSRYASYEQAYTTAKMIWDNAVYEATAHQNRQAALHAGIPLQIQNRLHVRNPGGRPRTVSRLSPLINAEILVAVNTAKRSKTNH